MDFPDCPLKDLQDEGAGPVPGDGPVPSSIMIVGEAPGASEAAKGRPFIGRSGIRLEAFLSIAGIKREDVYITNVEKYRPPGNRNPYAAEVKACSSYLEWEIEQVNPSLILAMGAIAVKWFLGSSVKLKKDHGYPYAWEGREVVPLYHPAATLHNHNLLPVLTGDFQRLHSIVRGKLPEPAVNEYSLGESGGDVAPGAYSSGIIGFDLETTAPTRGRFFAADEAEIVGYSVSSMPHKATYIPGAPGDLQDVLENPAITKVCHNAAFEYMKLGQMGITLTNFQDTKLAAQVLGYPSTHLKTLTRQLLGEDPITYEQATTNGPLSEQSPEDIKDYAAGDADHTLRVWKHEERQLRGHDLWHVYYDIELPLVPVVSEMERYGVLVDEYAAFAVHSHCVDQRGKSAAALHKLIDVSNPASPEQLAHALEKMGAPLEERTPSKGVFVTDDDALNQIKNWNPELIDGILEYRRWGKLGSYANNFIVLRGEDGRLHPTIHQAGGFEEGGGGDNLGPSTGRLAYGGPNLQNVPHRGDPEMVKAIRDCLVASPGMTLLAADVSQEEPRCLAFFSRDKQMLSDFSSGQSIYGFIGQALFDREIDKHADPREWWAAKTYFLALAYGGAPSKLQEIMPELSLSAATRGAQRLSSRYRYIKPYRREIVQGLIETYEVRDYFGRRRQFPAMAADSWADRDKAKRQGFNFTIQGPPASIIKMAMAKLYKTLPSDCHILLQVHDELVFELPLDKVTEVCNMCYNAFQVPDFIELPMEFSVGHAWGSLRPFTAQV